MTFYSHNLRPGDRVTVNNRFSGFHFRSGTVKQLEGRSSVWVEVDDHDGGLVGFAAWELYR